MKLSSRLVCGMSLGTAIMLLAGCGSTYYAVKDPIGGTTYYTNKVEEISGGAIKFNDAKSGTVVTIQNSAVKEISKTEFNVGVFTPEPAKNVATPGK